MDSNRRAASPEPDAQPVEAEHPGTLGGTTTDARPSTRNGWLQLSLRCVCKLGSAHEHYFPSRNACDSDEPHNGDDCVDDRTINVLLFVLVMLLMVLVFVG
jgi:hypothetical protein